MMRSHDRIEELIAIRSIGGLDQEDLVVLEQEMASHGPDCEECRRLETEYGEVAGRLGFALDPVAVREGFADETIELAIAREPGPPAVLERSAGGRWRPLVAVAAALVLFAGGALVGANVFGGAEVPPQATVLTFEAQDPSLTGTITAAFTPGEPGIYLQGAGLDALSPDEVYELWLIEGETPAAAVCVAPTEDGSVFAFADTEVVPDALLAVTVEPSSCSDAPTTPPIWVAPTTSA